MLKGYGAVILDGAWLTLQLALSSMALAIVLGLIGVALRLSPVRWLAWLGDLYSTVIRGIPDLVLILLIFYGGQDLLNRVAPLLGYDDYIDLNPLAAGIGTLGFIFGAYLSETFRGAFMAIPKGQAEAGMAYGMSSLQVFFRVHGAADDPPGDSGLHQQLAGADQGDRADFGGRPAGHDVQGQAGGRRHPRAFHLLPRSGGDVPGDDQCLVAGAASS
jgi:His/Glu/Gln/Arg/opine family amino acid ABC transporter permease subunit